MPSAIDFPRAAPNAKVTKINEDPAKRELPATRCRLRRGGEELSLQAQATRDVAEGFLQAVSRGSVAVERPGETYDEGDGPAPPCVLGLGMPLP